MKPSELLTAAADRLRDLAAKAADGPWTLTAFEVRGDPRTSLSAVVVDDFGDRVDVEVGVATAESDAAWIAALSPAVSPALEQILRDAARQWDVEARIFTPEATARKVTERRFAGPLALARLLVPEEAGVGLVGEEQQ